MRAGLLVFIFISITHCLPTADPVSVAGSPPACTVLDRYHGYCTSLGYGEVCEGVYEQGNCLDPSVPTHMYMKANL